MADTTVTFEISTKPGMIAGRVGDKEKVTLQPDSLPVLFDPEAVRRTVADADGNFRFPNLAPGRYQITAGTKTETVEISENQIRQVSFRQ